MKDPIDTVLIICCREDVGNNEFSAPGNNNRVVAEVAMFEENTCVFLMDANSILNSCTLACFVHECRIHIMNGPLAVTAQRQAIGHVTASVLAKIKCMLSLVRVLGI